MSKAANFDVPGYKAFKDRANDSTLSPNEKAGFPDSYRAGRSSAIFADICSKLPSLLRPKTSFLDIGPGCGELGIHITEHCQRLGIRHTVIDSADVLRLLPDYPNLAKVEGPFPQCLQGRAHPLGPFDGILAYSVVQYVFAESNIFSFVDSALQVLNQSGAFLIGDIPNATMRKRFLVSPNAKNYHRHHYPYLPEPRVNFNVPEPGQIDDSVVLGLLARIRAAGLHGFVIPQNIDLPMSNRREDILVQRP